MGLEAAVTRIDDSSDEEPLIPTWRDEVSQRDELGRGSDVRNVWVRVGDDVERPGTVNPTLLDSLAEDVGPNVGRMINPVLQVSESCWGEMEDIGDDEVPEWGVLPHPRLSLTPSLRIMLLNVTGLLIARTLQDDQE